MRSGASHWLQGSFDEDKKPLVAPRNCSYSAGARNEVPCVARSVTHLAGDHDAPIL